MSGFRDYLRGFCVLLSDTALCVLVFGLFPLFPDIGYVRIPVAAWVGIIAVFFLIDLVLMSRGLSMNAYLIWNAAVIMAGCAAVWLGTVCPAYRMMIPGMAAVCFACTAFHGSYLAYRLPGANLILCYVDFLVVFLAFYLYALLESADRVESGTAVLAGATMLLDLLAVNQIRTNDDDVGIIRGAGAGSRLMLGLIALAILGITGGLVGFASGQVHSLVDALLWLSLRVGRVLGAVITLFVTVIGWIIVILLLLLPGTPKAIEQNAQSMVDENIAGIVEETGLALPQWFWLAAGALLLAAFFAGLLYIFRGVNIGRVRRAVRRRRAVRKSYVLPALVSFFRRLRTAAVFEIRYRRNRKTLGGLLVYADRLGRRAALRIDRRGRSGRLARDPAESPGEYFRRLAERAEGPEKEADSGCLRELAARMDRAYYGGGSVKLSGEEFRTYTQILRRFSLR